MAGSVVSFAGVYAEGRLIGEAVSRYLRTWEPAAGNACYSETFAAPGDLRERVQGLLSHLGWEGLFELELIEGAGGAWHAIDFNPRPYGSLALAIGAGAKLPAIWCRHLLGEEVVPTRASAGALYRWTDADLRHGLWQLRHGSGASAARALRPRRDVVHPYLRAGDPGPGVARLLELGAHAVARSRRRGPGRPATAVIGAGPNGLAASAHLRALGIDTRCFGEPMESWVRQMPAGMLLLAVALLAHIRSAPCRASAARMPTITTTSPASLAGGSRSSAVVRARWSAPRSCTSAARRHRSSAALPRSTGWPPTPTTAARALGDCRSPSHRRRPTSAVA